MKPVFAKKAARPDPELLTLKAELLEAQGDLAQAYRQFDQALDPELVESCVYQISAVMETDSSRPASTRSRTSVSFSDSFPMT